MTLKSIFARLKNVHSLENLRYSINERLSRTCPRVLKYDDSGNQAFDVHVKCVASSKQPVVLWKHRETDVTDIAGMIHRHSPFGTQQFATVSCRTNPFETWALALADLIDPDQPAKDTGQSENGAAVRPGGTLFLNDLEFLPHELQILLHALLNEERIIRFPGTHIPEAEIRVITSSTMDIWRKCQDGLFHANLFFQLNRLTVHCGSSSRHSAHAHPETQPAFEQSELAYATSGTN